MNTARRAILVAGASALALAALFVAGGCEDTDPSAQTDWTVTVAANPASIDLGAETTGDSTITAVVYNKDGIVQPGIGVRFTTTAGTLSTDLVDTNGRGEAIVTLTTGVDATVTATSGSKSDSVDVSVGGVNSPPTASISLTPTGEARKTQSVLFSGSLSEDLDGEVVRYLWTIFSDNPDPSKANPYIKDTTNQAFNESFTNEQTLDITLQVTDNLGATGSDVEQLAILANMAPKAEAGPATDGIVTAGPPYGCSVQLSGAQSADQDGSTCPQCLVVTYEWNWGDGRIDRVSGSTIAQHTYRAADSYTVNLIVYDNGEDGICGAVPATGDPLSNCPTRKASTPDTTTVTCAAAP